jgi:hypothetical protein
MALSPPGPPFTAGSGHPPSILNASPIHGAYRFGFSPLVIWSNVDRPSEMVWLQTGSGRLELGSEQHSCAMRASGFIPEVYRPA